MGGSWNISTPIRVSRSSSGTSSGIFSITRSTVTNILQLMERKGYIERQSVPQDARLKMLVLTAKGLEFHEKTMLSLHQTDEFVAGLLTEEENTELLRLLNKLKNGLNDSQI